MIVEYYLDKKHSDHQPHLSFSELVRYQSGVDTVRATVDTGRGNPHSVCTVHQRELQSNRGDDNDLVDLYRGAHNKG